MKKITSIILNSAVMIFCIIYLFPVYIIVVNAFKERKELFESVIALPSNFDFKYFVNAFEKMKFLSAFKNSIIITVVSIIFIVIFASMCAWMLVRVNNVVSKVILSAFIATMLIPFQTLMMPLLLEMSFIQNTFGLPMLDNLFGMIFMNVGFGASLAVFLYHGFVKSIPASLEEAATIDGCNVWSVYWRIVFPMLKPTTVTLIILDVIWIWNDYLLPSLVLTGETNRTIPLSTASFFGQFTIQWNLAMAGLTLTILPVIIFYLFAQKYIIKGIAAGALK